MSEELTTAQKIGLLLFVGGVLMFVWGIPFIMVFGYNGSIPVIAGLLSALGFFLVFFYGTKNKVLEQKFRQFQDIDYEIRVVKVPKRLLVEKKCANLYCGVCGNFGG